MLYQFCNYFKTTLRPNWLSLYLNFCSLSSTKPLLASVWRSNFYVRISEPRACDAYYHPLLSNFLKISRSSDNERQTGEEEEGQEAGAEGGVEVDEKPVGDQWCCGIRIKCFCFTLTAIFHVQVEVQVEFIYLSVNGAE